MTKYIVMIISVLLASLNSLVLRKFKNKSFKTPGDSFFFNGSMSLIWTFIMSLVFIFSKDSRFNPLAIIFGAVYGIILCLFLYFKNESIAEGPVSLTSLIGNCAFIPATFFGVIYASESISVFQIVGILMMLFALFLCINPKKSGEPLTAKWFILCLSFFIAGGFIGMFYKVFGKSEAAADVNLMMLSASAVSCILFFLFGLIINKSRKSAAPTVSRVALPYVLIAGVTGCAYIRLNVSLSALIPSPIFFPVANGGIVIITTLIGAFLFRERLSRTQIWGILIGLLALVTTGGGEAIYNLIFR